MQPRQYLQLIMGLVSSLLPRNKGIVNMLGGGDIPGVASQ